MSLTQGPWALRSRVLRILAYRLLCDLKFRFRTQTIMWLEVLQFRFHTWNILWLKFRLRKRNILRLKVPLPHTEWCVTWSSEMAQFHLRTRKILWLGSYAVPLPYNKFHASHKIGSFAVPLPYKSFDFKSRSFASAQRIFCDLKFHSFASAQGIYYV